MEELKQLLHDDKTLLRMVDNDLKEMKQVFMLFFEKQEKFMETMQKFIQSRAGNDTGY